MKKKQFLNRLNQIRDTISSDPATAIEQLDSLSKVSIPIEEAHFFIRYISFTRAHAAYAQKDFDVCITEISKYIHLENEANNELGEAYLLRGKAYFYKGAPEKCLSDLESAYTENLDPDLWVDLYKHRGKACLTLEDFDAAIAAFQDVKGIAPEDTSNLSALATAYMHTENYSEAVTLLAEAARMQPERPDILSDLGKACFECGEYERAEAVFTTAINLDPNDALLYQQRAIALKQIGKKNAAEDWMIFQFLNRG